MTDHTTTSPVLLDRESILRTLLEAIDSAVEVDKKLHGSSRPSIHLERIKHLADKYKEAAH